LQRQLLDHLEREEDGDSRALREALDGAAIDDLATQHARTATVGLS
jgi:hypothetical protein